MSAIIFDFDGTIADSFGTIVGIFYKLTKHEAALNDAEIQRLRGMTMIQAVEELNIPPWKVPFLLFLGRRQMTKNMKHIAVHRGIPETIRKLMAEGHQLYIMSSNSEKNIRVFLDKHNMTNEFVNIYGSVGLFNKAKALKKVISKNNLNVTDTWYIGDEIRDVVGAHHAEVPIMAASWGFNTAEILSTYNPTILLSTPNDIITTLEN